MSLELNAFITGSRAFGTPRDDSDLDLVILTDAETKNAVVEFSELGKQPVRFGKLNLIVVTSIEEFEAYATARKECLPYSSRDKAFAVHRKVLRALAAKKRGSREPE